MKRYNWHINPSTQVLLDFNFGNTIPYKVYVLLLSSTSLYTKSQFYFCSSLSKQCTTFSTVWQAQNDTNIINCKLSVLVDYFRHFLHIFIRLALRWPTQTSKILNQSLIKFKTWMLFAGFCFTCGIIARRVKAFCHTTSILKFKTKFYARSVCLKISHVTR